MDGERGDASERCRQRENERARAQAAAARHDPLRVHDRLRCSDSPRQRAARVGVEREVVRGLAAPGAEKAAAAIMAALSTHRAGGSRLSPAPRRGAGVGQGRAQRAVRGDAADDGELARDPSHRVPRRRARRAAARSPPERLAARSARASGQLVAELAHTAQERRLQAREREVVTVLTLQHRREREALRDRRRARRARVPRRPASLSPSRRAPLSNASPAASSRVPPSRTGAA